jgi:hypothetical protein
MVVTDCKSAATYLGQTVFSPNVWGLTMRVITHETRADATDLAPVPESRIHRILPQAMVGIGLGLTVAWVCVLGYGFIALIWATI